MTTRKIAYIFRQLTLLSVILSGFCGLASAQDYDIEVPGLDPVTPAATEGATLFENVRIFDGNGLDLSPPSNLLVRGNTIERISVDPIDVASAASGETWSINRPELPPEKRPSVTSAQTVPSPCCGRGWWCGSDRLA